MVISKSQVNYIYAPEEIISDTKKHYIIRLGHFIPSVILTIILVVKILPDYLEILREYLDRNAAGIWAFVIPTYILTVLLLGFIIERILEMTNHNYKSYKKWLKENDV